MEKLTGCFLSAVLLLTVLSFVLAEDKLLYFGEGGKLVLRPRFSEEITSIMWGHNYDLVAKWVKEEVPLQYHGTFEGRTSLDTTTGSLEIINMSRADSGDYFVIINHDLQAERYNATLIEAVPKPTVLVLSLKGTTAIKQYLLTCDGNTEEAEPVTYSWKIGGEVWLDGEKNRSITNDETTQRIKTFTCRMKNPISVEESEPIDNIFFKHVENNSVSVGVGVVSASSGDGLSVDLFLLVVGILAAVVGEGF